MWSEKQNKSFTLMWTVENTRYMLENKKYRSPEFINIFDKTQWRLELKQKDSYLELYICPRKSSDATVNLEVSFLASDGSDSDRFCKELKERKVSAAFPFYIRFFKETLKSRRIELFPGDKIIVMVRIWNDDKGDLLESSAVFARTRIGTERVSFAWTVADLHSLPSNKKQIIDIKSKVKQMESLHLELVLDKESVLNVAVVPVLNQTGPISSNVLLHVLDSLGKDVRHCEDIELIFLRSPIKQLLSFNCLGEDGVLYIPGDGLLRFQYVMFGGVVANYIENTSINNCLEKENAPLKSNPLCRDASYHNKTDTEINELDSMINEIKTLFSNQTLADYTLKTELKSFSVHKAILCARSPVFRAMLTSNMIESQRDTMSIPDVDTDTLNRFLMYLYTNAMDVDLHWEDISKLYSVGDKYEVLSLRDKCKTILKSCISLENVLDILVLANMHLDNELEKVAFHFILLHHEVIIGEEKWIKFESENSSLALETFTKVINVLC